MHRIGNAKDNDNVCIQAIGDRRSNCFSSLSLHWCLQMFCSCRNYNYFDNSYDKDHDIDDDKDDYKDDCENDVNCYYSTANQISYSTIKRRHNSHNETNEATDYGNRGADDDVDMRSRHVGLPMRFEQQLCIRQLVQQRRVHPIQTVRLWRFGLSLHT